jgi:hypothetical protein
MTGMFHQFQLLAEMGLANLSSRLASNCDSPNLLLPNSWDIGMHFHA